MSPLTDSEEEKLKKAREELEEAWRAGLDELKQNQKITDGLIKELLKTASMPERWDKRFWL